MSRSTQRVQRELLLHEPVAVRALMARNRLIGLLKRFPDRLVWAFSIFLTSLISIATLGGVERFSGSPSIFPSLGPTAILFFFHPLSPSASPRHATYGHAIGILCGYSSLTFLAFSMCRPTSGCPLTSGGWRPWRFLSREAVP